MSMSPESYRNVLNKANKVVIKLGGYTKEEMPISFNEENKAAYAEVNREIGKLEVYILEHKNPSKYVTVKEELERVKQNLSELL